LTFNQLLGLEPTDLTTDRCIHIIYSTLVKLTILFNLTVIGTIKFDNDIS
jgi:hypothetical protein